MAKVLMLVNNDWEIDSRVIREAEALACDGHSVHVIARQDVSVVSYCLNNHVAYHSVPLNSPLSRWGRAIGLLKLHAGVLAAAKDTPLRGEVLRNVVITLLKIAVVGSIFVIFSPLLLPVAFALIVIRRLYRNEKLRRAVGNSWLFVSIKPWLMRWGKFAFSLLITGPYKHVFTEHVTYLNQYGLDVQRMGLDLCPDVVHSHDLVTLSTGYAIASKLGVPLIYDAHELETHTNYWGLAAATKKWIAIYEECLIKRCSAVVTVCDSISNWLKETYQIAQPLVVLNSPDMSVEQASKRGTNIRESLGLSADTPLAIYVGSVTIDRGLAECVKATALIDNLHFAFVGPRYSVTEAEILRLAKSLKISDRIHLVDPVPSKTVKSFVSTADCSVIAIQNVCLSYYFCFPNKLLESVIGGVPIVAARLVELERFLQRFQVGVVVDETAPSSIAEGIQKVIGNPESYRASEIDKTTITQEYGWIAQANKLKTLYKHVLLAGPRISSL